MNNYFIGIDFSKNTFDATLLAKENLTGQGLHSVFENNDSGVKKFRKWITTSIGRCLKDDVLICGEDTGVYSKLVCDSLSAQGYTMWLESALQIKRSMGLSRGKNDKKDSRDIAEYAARHADKCRPYKMASKEVEALHVLFSQRRLLVTHKSSLKRRSGELKDKFKKNPLLRMSRKCDDKLVKVYAEEIKRIEKQMQDIINNCEELKRNYDIITSMKGIGLVNAVALLIHTDNFNRFDYDARKICSFWGIAPFANQSGTSMKGTPHVSHFADSYLKALLSEAVLAAKCFCPEIRAYAERLKGKGKHPAIVNNNCKNKMIHILVAMVKNGTRYGEIKKTSYNENM